MQIFFLHNMSQGSPKNQFSQNLSKESIFTKSPFALLPSVADEIRKGLPLQSDLDLYIKELDFKSLQSSYNPGEYITKKCIIKRSDYLEKENDMLENKIKPQEWTDSD